MPTRERPRWLVGALSALVQIGTKAAGATRETGAVGGAVTTAEAIAEENGREEAGKIQDENVEVSNRNIA